MPPRHAYWTIIIDDQPTSFRAHDVEELLPTFNRLREKNPTAQLKWFERGQLWDTRDAARAEGFGKGERRWEGPRPDRDSPSDVRRGGPLGPPERRDRTWRPGGEHRDPRQKYKDAQKAKWQEFKKTLHTRWEEKQRRPGPPKGPPFGREEGPGPPRPFGREQGLGPPKRPFGREGGRPREDDRRGARPARPERADASRGERREDVRRGGWKPEGRPPAGPRKPWGTKPSGPRKPWGGKPTGPPRSSGARKPWGAKPSGGPKKPYRSGPPRPPRPESRGPRGPKKRRDEE